MRKWSKFMAPVLLVAGYLVYWYAQSPVGAGVYPGRVTGAAVLLESPMTAYDLPVVWVRPFPWSKEPPLVEMAALLEDGHIFASMSGSRLTPDRKPGLFSRRVVFGHISVPVAGTHTLTGVQLRLQGQPSRVYGNGPMTIWVRKPGPAEQLNVVGLAGDWVPGPGHLDADGYYILLQGGGTVTDVVTGLPGMTHPPEGLRQQHLATMSAFTPQPGTWKRFEPATLPLDVSGSTVLYVPMTDEVRQGIRNTHAAFSPMVIYRTNQGEHMASGVSSGMVFLDKSSWRQWVPFFIYKPAQ